MALKEKIISALLPVLKAEYARLEDEDGISGFIVSRQFHGVSALDRQEKIDQALRRIPLTPDERRRVLMIAGLTPEEYDAVGLRIRIHRVKDMPGGAVQVLLHGGVSDAEYVRAALNHGNGIQTTEPKRADGPPGVLTSVRAKGTEASPLTRDKAIQALKRDPHIEVMPNA